MNWLMLMMSCASGSGSWYTYEESVDDDGDGANSTVDCDDNDNTVQPGANEICDGKDNDCDGSSDQNAVSGTEDYYQDVDGDGYGVESVALKACPLAIPAGYVSLYGDCNDNDVGSNPDATEICDETDNDCDGQIDEGETETYYYDSDGDGYGDDAVTTEACGAPENYVEQGGDCNDADEIFYPGAPEECGDDYDYNCDGSLPSDDVDGDGYMACEECDDTNEAINPVATEVCDGGIDNDCNGVADDDDPGTDPSTKENFYADEDTDGFGNPEFIAEACSVPDGFVSDATDCDDGDADINPDATEVCDGYVDNDCNGVADDDDPGTDSSTKSPFYADTDEDGFGDVDASADLCAEADGYVSDATDCDDGDGTVYQTATIYADADGDTYTSTSSLECIGDEAPDGYSLTASTTTDCDDSDETISPAATEICDSGIDNDCNGVADDADPGTDASSMSAFYLDDDGDGYGDADLPTSACTTPAGYVTDASDCDDADELTFPGASEIWDGVVNDCDATSSSEEIELSSSLITITPEGSADTFPAALSIGDIDGDGNQDLCLGAPRNDDTSAYGVSGTEGAAYLIYGPLSASMGAGSADAKFPGTNSGSFGGDVVDCTSDLSGDGISDFITSAIYNDGAGIVCGDSLPSGNMNMASFDWCIEGLDSQGLFGDTIYAGADFGGDGNKDLIVGERGWEGTTPGYAYIFSGPISAGAYEAVTDSASIITGAIDNDQSGFSVTGGDLDGDGIDDAVVSSLGADGGAGAYSGKIQVILAPVPASVGLATDGDITINGPSAYSYLGYSMLANSDATGDGTNDLLIGAPGAEKAFLLDGSTSYSSSSHSYSATSLYAQFSSSTGQNTGAKVAMADIDFDGQSEVFIGANYNDDNGTDAGKVCQIGSVVSASYDLDTDCDAFLFGGTAEERAGYPFVIGDLTADGNPDLLVGAMNYGSGSGIAYLLENYH